MREASIAFGKHPPAGVTHDRHRRAFYQGCVVGAPKPWFFSQARHFTCRANVVVYHNHKPHGYARTYHFQLQSGQWRINR